MIEDLFDPEQPHQAPGLYTDRGIKWLIREGHITVRNQERFLADGWTEYVQPGSMDVPLGKNGDEWDFAEPVDELEDLVKCHPDAKLFYSPHHPALGKDYVTFWPGHMTVWPMQNLTRCTSSAVMPILAIRSTPRRLGLDAGFAITRHSKTRWAGSILNARNYPISVQAGTRLWQLLWSEHPYPQWDGQDIHFYNAGEVPKNDRRSQGRYVTSRKQTLELMRRGHLEFSTDVQIHKSGAIFLTAGKKETAYSQKHLVLHKDGRKTDLEGNKLQLAEEEKNTHLLSPGQFLDIQTRESMRLSQRVGLMVYYGHINRNIPPVLPLREYLSRFMTTSLQGGWIDQYYPGPNRNDWGRFSVQLIALTQDLIIKEGDIVAAAVPIFYNEDPELPYGHSGRNSQYSDPKKGLHGNKA